jgi:hypothetical protein
MTANKYSGVIQLNDLDDFIGPGLVSNIIYFLLKFFQMIILN